MSVEFFSQVMREKLPEMQRSIRALSSRAGSCLQGTDEDRNSLYRLQQELDQLGSSLPSKERTISSALDKWGEFQDTLLKLAEVDSWVAQRQVDLDDTTRLRTDDELQASLQDVKVTNAQFLEHGAHQCLRPSEII